MIHESFPQRTIKPKLSTVCAPRELLIFFTAAKLIFTRLELEHFFTSNLMSKCQVGPAAHSLSQSKSLNKEPSPSNLIQIFRMQCHRTIFCVANRLRITRIATAKIHDINSRVSCTTTAHTNHRDKASINYDFTASHDLQQFARRISLVLARSSSPPSTPKMGERRKIIILISEVAICCINNDSHFACRFITTGRRRRKNTSAFLFASQTLLWRLFQTREFRSWCWLTLAFAIFFPSAVFAFCI